MALSFEEKKRYLKKIEQLLASAQSVVRRGDRTTQDVMTLFSAIETFNSEQHRKKAKNSSLTSYQLESLSVPLADVRNLPLPLKSYLKLNNIKLVAELYFVQPPVDADGMLRAREDLLTLLGQRYQLPRNLDPWIAGWKPPYRDLLDNTIEDLHLSDETIRSLELIPISTIGQLVLWNAEELRHRRINGRAFPRRSVSEIEQKLAPLGLRLAIPLPEAVRTRIQQTSR